MSNPIEKFINTYEGYAPSSTLFRSFFDDAINYAKNSNKQLNMDLRDYFAAKAMLGMIGREGRRFELSDVELAYQIADAMIKAREQ